MWLACGNSGKILVEPTQHNIVGAEIGVYSYITLKFSMWPLVLIFWCIVSAPELGKSNDHRNRFNQEQYCFL
jgi:hypothetical protein